MERTRMERRTTLRRQVTCGRLALLALVGLSLINQLLLIFGVNYHFWISAAVPYYINWFCVQMDASVLTRILCGMAAAAVYITYIGCLVLSLKKRYWMTFFMGLYALDTLLLIFFSFTLLSNPVSCLLEIAVHIGCLVLLVMADQAAAELTRKRRSPRRRPMERESIYE